MLILKDFRVEKSKNKLQKAQMLYCGDVLIGVATENVFKKRCKTIGGYEYVTNYIFNWKVKIAEYGEPFGSNTIDDLCMRAKDKFSDFILAVLR